MKFAFLSLFFSVSAFGATELSLRTPRGTDVHVILHRTTTNQHRSTLVLAPGQSCNYKNNLFEAIGAEGEKSDVAVIRFEWSYCNNPKAQERVPSDDLSNEIEDFQTVLTFAKNFNFGDQTKIIIGGKSLGSLVSYQVFAKETSLRSLLLLTPVCTYKPDPQSAPASCAEENYPNIGTETRPILFALGNQDPLCALPMLFDYLKITKGNVTALAGIGDHGFRSVKPSGEVDQEQTQKNIDAILAPIFNWLTVQSIK